MKKPDIHESWNNLLKAEFQKDYMQELRQFLKTELSNGEKLYPPMNQVFEALKTNSISSVKVVILGQDPYHGKGQAHGLCFSVQKGIKPPPSLVNIFKEISTDLNILCNPSHGFLEKWSNEGVLLLNTVLTVRANQPASHRNKGWENFTDKIIEILNEYGNHIVFLLWGKFAHSKENMINTNKHCVLKAAHPSPYSANNGFFNCRHFSKTNQYLVAKGLKEIDWKIE